MKDASNDHPEIRDRKNVRDVSHGEESPKGKSQSNAATKKNTTEKVVKPKSK